MEKNDVIALGLAIVGFVVMVIQVGSCTLQTSQACYKAKVELAKSPQTAPMAATMGCGSARP